MSDHAQFAPSSLSRTIACPGSVVLGQKVPEPPQTARATEGTLLHDVIAKFISNEITDYEFEVGFGLNEEQKERIYEAVSYYTAIRAACGLENIKGEFFEKQVKLRKIPEVYGTLDAGFYTATEVHIFDWKFGRVHVAAKDNKQLLAYLVGFLGDIPEEIASTATWYVHIVQPRIDNFDMWNVEIEDVWTFLSDVQNAIKDALSSSPSFNPGEPQCMWCRAVPICPTRIAKMEEEISEVFAELAKPRLETSSITGILDKAQTLTENLRSIQSFAEMELLKGKIVEGYKLVEGRGRRAWMEGVGYDELAEILKVHNVDPDIIVEERKIKSPRQVLLSLPQNEELKSAVSDLIFMKRGPMKLVREEHPGDPFEPMIKED